MSGRVTPPHIEGEWVRRPQVGCRKLWPIAPVLEATLVFVP